MPTNSESNFRESVKHHLSEIESDLIGVLETLIQHDYPKEVCALAFEVFSDSFTSQFPARAFFMDKSNSEFFTYINGKASYPCSVDPGLLAIPYTYPESIEELALASDPELDTWAIASSEFITWFAACWERAGGLQFQLAATIATHDSSQEFNLKTMQWQPSYSGFAT